GAVLATSELAFGLIKWFGVAYLLWLAWKQWQALPQALDDSAAPRPIGRPLSRVLRGSVGNASNPKALVVILAVPPQFLDPTKPLLLQYVEMGATMVVVDLLVMAGYTGLAARVLRLLRTPRQQRLVNRSFATMFAGAAALLATVKRAAT